MRRNLFLSIAVACLLTPTVASKCNAADDVTVTVAPSTVEYQYYEGSKPDKVPIGMKALTEPSWKFSCHFNWVHYDSPGSYRFVIKSAACDLSLPVLITLPKDAGDKLKAHEQGHLHINEHFYKQYAEAAIKKAAGSLIGKEYTIEAPDYDEAKKKLVPMTVKDVQTLYRAQTYTPSEKANVLYDSLTDHGRKTEFDSETAATQAVKEVEHSDMQPTASSETR
ncbi:MAG: hypothetical protein JST89_10525 [Cyanobacteria bacterium SZAS-4]|nr:hypothetical protein [Cyanobacteria bacterium SZAS-4]